MPGNAVLIPGEELTCRTFNGKNVHMLVLGEKRFMQGAGDSAQEWFQTRSHFTVRHAIAYMTSSAVAIAAHPLDRVPFLQKLLVNRSIWQDNDLNAAELSGWQILNGNQGKGFKTGLKAWITALLNGERHCIYAGNDSHGNFNRFKQVKMPMISLYEHDNYIFGKSTTHLFINETPTTENVLDALRMGRAIISTGPVIEMTVLDESNEYFIGDETVSDPDSVIHITCKSSQEFGSIEKIVVFTAGIGKEKPIFQKNFNERIDENHFYEEFEFQMQGNIYLRAEVHTRLENGSTRFAYSNPIWLRTTES